MSVTIVRTIACLAAPSTLSCVADGIEADAQLLALPSGLVGQGWLLSRPVSPVLRRVLLGPCRSCGPGQGLSDVYMLRDRRRRAERGMIDRSRREHHPVFGVTDNWGQRALSGF